MVKKTICCLVGFCLFVIYPADIFAAKRPARFVYQPAAGETVRSITIAGSFNNWNSSANPLVRQPDGKYSIKLLLGEGLHTYKFVIDGTRWIEDPLADRSLRKDDGYGGFNSGVIVGERADIFGKAAPGQIVSGALKHNPDDIRFFNVAAKDLIEIKLRTLQDDVDTATLVVGNEEFSMRKSKTALGFDYYSVVIEIEKGKQGQIEYHFLLADGPAVIRYPAEKNFAGDLKPIFYTPEWAKKAVWYQIMLDRFYDGEPANNPANSLPWTWDFSKTHPTEKGSFYEFVWGRRFGGDLQGLIKKLDYLKELGITAIYLTPVFKADSPHKYNTVDYRHIDDHLGFRGDIFEIKGETKDPKTWQWTKTDKLFLEFLAKARAHGMRVIIDGVFNHSGEDFWAFRDLKRKGRKSKFRDWFVVTDWAVFEKFSHEGKGYSGWAGFGGLPEFAEDEKGLVKPVKKHIFDITRRWMDPNGDGDPSDGIDGWRLDVPECVRKEFWVEWSALVRSINPEAYIAGELWGEAPTWLTAEMFHAQMNYPLVKRIIKFLVDKGYSPSQFDKSIHELLDIYPLQVHLVQQNLLDSHDTDRAVSMFYNPHRPYDKRNRLNPSDTGDYNPNYKTGKPPAGVYEHLKLVSVLQFTLPGAPMIWYGNEVGMWGSDDPFNRKPMLWKELQPYDEKGAFVMEDLLDFYKKLIAIRNASPEFQTGIFETVLTDDKKNVYAFSRTKGKRVGFVALNNSKKKVNVALRVDDTAVADRTRFFDALNNKNYTVRNNYLRIVLPPESASVLVMK